MTGNKTDNGVLEQGTDEARISYSEDTPGQNVESFIKEREKAFHETHDRTKKHFSSVFGNPLENYPYNDAIKIKPIKESFEELEMADNISKMLVDNQILGKGIVLDVKDKDQIASLGESIKKDFGSIDILVNNAGITRDNILLRMKEDEWEDIINTNLSSVYKMSKSVLRGMIKKRSGRIISITSVVGAMGNAGQSNYAAAKAGMIGFTKSLAREVGVRGITVNAIAPGFIETDMTDSLPDDQKEALASQIPMGRLGRRLVT